MCLENIRLGRKLWIKPYPLALAANTGGVVAPADSLRVGLSAAWNPDIGLPSATTVGIGPLVNGVVLPVAVLTPEVASLYLDVWRYGSVLTGELRAVWNGGDVSSVVLFGYLLNEE